MKKVQKKTTKKNKQKNIEIDKVKVLLAYLQFHEMALGMGLNPAELTHLLKTMYQAALETNKKCGSKVK